MTVEADKKRNFLLHCAKKTVAAFDFKRVHQAMMVMGWTWVVDGTQGKVIPSIDRIRKTAVSLLKQCIDVAIKERPKDPPTTTMSTGGFRASVSLNPGFVQLSFEVESSETFFPPHDQGEPLPLSLSVDDAETEPPVETPKLFMPEEDWI